MSWRSDAAFLAGGALLSAFFSGAETGAYVLSRLRLRYRAREEDLAWAKRLERLLDDMPVFVTAMLVWTNLALDLVSAACTSLYARAGLGIRPEIAATLTAAPVLFVFTELVPKNLFRLRAEGLMAPSARALSVSVYVVRPIAAVFSGLGRVVRRGLGLAEPGHWADVTRRAVQARFAESAERGGLTLPQRDLADNIMQAGSRRALDAATPVARMAAIHEDATAGELLAAAAPPRPGGSAATPIVLVHRGDPSAEGARERAVGVVHPIRAWGVPPETPLSALVTPPVHIDEDASIIQALVALRRAGEEVGVIAAAESNRDAQDSQDGERRVSSPSRRPSRSSPLPAGRRARAVVSVEQLVRHLVGS